MFIAAAAATFAVLFFYFSYILRIGDKKDYSRLLAAVLLTLPLSAIAYYGLHLPLDNVIGAVFSRESVLYRFIKMGYGPVINETVKLAPLLLPFIHRRILPKNFVAFGMALGLGFGIGEIWLTAFQTSHIPANFFLPFGYVLFGFLAERLMFCFLHGAFTSLVLFRWKRRWGIGLVKAIGLHLLAVLPLHLSQMNILGISPRAWRSILPLYLVFFFICMILMLIFLRSGIKGIHEIFVRANINCANCGKPYKRSFWITNVSNKEYDYCPNCGSKNQINFKDRP
jgi:DNA-directed RNA polymerase subunit RPC12/RpoP